MMSRRNFLLASCLALTSWALGPVPAHPDAGRPTSLTARFSPRGGCADLVLAAVGESKESVLVQAYYLTSKPIAEALAKAARRGVRVEVIADAKAAKAGAGHFAAITAAGGKVWLDRHHAIQHNKTMVIDGAVVLTGSYNWTASAEGRNAENLLLVRSKELAALYAEDWLRHRGHSEAWKP